MVRQHCLFRILLTVLAAGLVGCSTVGRTNPDKHLITAGEVTISRLPQLSQTYERQLAQANSPETVTPTRSDQPRHNAQWPQGRFPVQPVSNVEEAPTLAPPQEFKTEAHPAETQLRIPDKIAATPQVTSALVAKEAQSAVKSKVYPIGLSQTLTLAGANHLQVQIAQQRVLEAHARLLEARVNWLPSIRFGIGWNKHDGRIQATPGDIIEASRNSTFIGGGAGIGGFPLAGAGGGPLRMMINLSLADVLFEKTVQERLTEAADQTETAVTQTALRQAATGYFDLVEAYALRANAQQALRWTVQLQTLVAKFAKAGAGSLAEVDRANAAQAAAQQELADADRLVQERSVSLARILRLDVSVRLAPVEEKVMPINMVEPTKPLAELLAVGLSNRPEIGRQESITAAMEERLAQARWRPWLPNLIAGASAGAFGGGPSAAFNDQGSRSDVDLAAYWELANGGLGNRAERQRRSSQWRQSQLQEQWVRDQVAAEIAASLANVRSFEKQIGITRTNVQAAQKSYQRNYQRVLEAEGLPLELLQAIEARRQSLDRYTRTVARYNRAQFRLLHSVGQMQSP